MGACFYRLRCEVFQNLFLSPMNTGFVRPAVATVLTACGIETAFDDGMGRKNLQLQQYLPLAVLKHYTLNSKRFIVTSVATVLTACGIETILCRHLRHSTPIVATVLTACGIETEDMR